MTHNRNLQPISDLLRGTRYLKPIAVTLVARAVVLAATGYLNRQLPASSPDDWRVVSFKDGVIKIFAFSAPAKFALEKLATRTVAGLTEEFPELNISKMEVKFGRAADRAQE